VTVCIGHGPGHVLKLVLNVFRSQLVFCWFASVYAAVGTLVAGALGKNSIIVIGGVDLAKEKEFGYGLWRSPWKAMLVGRAIKTANRVVVVDQSLKAELLDRVKYTGNNVEVLSTRFDQDTWHPAGIKEPIVLTVAAIQSEGRFKIKGIDVLIEVARQLPQVRFVLVGVSPDRFPNTARPENLTVHPSLQQMELLHYYQRAKVYVQPSRREGLSNALCEAMLCGCIPVATDVGGSSRAIGETGFVVPVGNPNALADGIVKALELPAGNGILARERIIALYPKGQREVRLEQLIRELTQ